MLWAQVDIHCSAVASACHCGVLASTGPHCAPSHQGVVVSHAGSVYEQAASRIRCPADTKGVIVFVQEYVTGKKVELQAPPRQPPRKVHSA